MHRTAFFTMAALASAAVFGQGLLDCVEPDVLRALVLQGQREQAPLISGALPAELSTLRLPREFSWIGSAERITGRVDANTNATQVTAAWRSSLPVDAAREAARSALAASGWEVRSMGIFMNMKGGFRASFLSVPMTACRDGKPVDVNVSAMDGATYLLLVVRRGMANSLCNQPVPNMGAASGWLGEYMPRLDLPAAAGPVIANVSGFSGAGSSNGSTVASTSMDFVLQDSIDNIARHFARQIAEQGWSSDTSWSGGSTAGSSWSKRVDGGALMLGTLALTAIDRQQFAASFRVSRLR